MELKQLLTFIYILFSCLYFTNGSELLNTTVDIVLSNNYLVESHTVTTEDGYILEMFRILPKVKSEPYYAYIVMHDALGSSDDFVVGDFNNSFTYSIISLGYEVWLTNARGNKYSKEHITLNSSIDDKSYWNFSWHEIGVYDLPETIDYVINVTGSQQVIYYGVGQGGTAALVLLSMLPQYNDKLHAVFTFGPIAFLGNVSSPYIRSRAYEYTQSQIFVKRFGSSEVVYREYVLNDFGRLECRNSTNNSPVCDNFYFLASSYNPSYSYTDSDISHLLSHTTTSCSTNQFFHYGQLVISGRFAQFDYGPDINMIKYGSIAPPDYDLNKINTPFFVYFSIDDLTSSKQDREQLLQYRNMYIIPRFSKCDYFEHIDFYNFNKFVNCFLKK